MLERVIEMSDGLLFCIPDEHPERGNVLFPQAQAYTALYSISGEAAFLEVAV